jgi:hypothetical protein
MDKNIKKELDSMFQTVGIKKTVLHDALRKMGKKYLTAGKGEWTPEKPTTGYCYVVSEYVYHYLAPFGTKSYRLKTEDGSHWFLKYPNGKIIDLTADQSDKVFKYEDAVETPFRTSKISERGAILANILK